MVENEADTTSGGEAVLPTQEEIQRALRQTEKNETEVIAEGKDWFWLTTHAVLIIGFSVLHYLLGLKIVPLNDQQTALAQRFTRGVTLTILVMALAKIVEVYLIGRVESPVSRYNLRRILNLMTVIVIGFIALSVVFVNWYAAVVSLGLISLIMGFALQTPITSFIGWIYILVREPYRVGDRIKLDDITGDVIDVSYIDTTLWEFGGQYVSGDHPSGRVIKFPNSKVLNTPVFNYSWPLFPYIWNEIKFQVAYNSDLEFIDKTMRKTVEDELGEPMMERVKTFRELLAKTPIDQLEVRERPAVLFRVSDNTWLEAIVRYLVHPKEAGRVKTRLIKQLLTRLNQHPDLVRFPRDDSR